MEEDEDMSDPPAEEAKGKDYNIEVLADNLCKMIEIKASTLIEEELFEEDNESSEDEEEEELLPGIDIDFAVPTANLEPPPDDQAAAPKKRGRRPKPKRAKGQRGRLAGSESSKAISRHSHGRKKKGQKHSKYKYVRKNPDTGTRTRVTISPAPDTIPFKDLQLKPMTNDKHIRITIATVYERFFDCAESGKWAGIDGTISQIIKMLPFLGNSSSSRERVRKVLVNANCCNNNGLEYTGERNTENTGRPVVIKPGTFEETYIADLMETGIGLKKTWKLVNEHLKEQGDRAVTLSAVTGCYSRLNPVVKPTKKSSQAGQVGSVWAWAKRNWAIHLGIRAGKLDYQTMVYEDTSKENPLIGPIPKWFDRKLLLDGGYCFTREQIGWWDEKHREVVIGGMTMGHDQVQIRFPRDENGKLDPSGKCKPFDTLHAVKYPGQCRLGLGMAKVKLMKECKEDEDGWIIIETETECRRCEPFDYTAKTLGTIEDLEDVKHRENRRVNALTHGGIWVTKFREDGDFWRADETQRLPGVADKTKKKLSDAGIATISDLIDLGDDSVEEAARKSTLTQNKIRSLRSTAVAGVKEGEPPAQDYFNHHKQPEPYKSRYPDNWEEKLNKSALVSSWVCVTELIEHMDKETTRMFEGTMDEFQYNLDGTRKKRPHKWYHDALSLATAKTTRRWMDQQGIDNWILPVLGLNTGRGGNWHERCPGNSPTFMPWDEQGNYYADASVDEHVIGTRHLDDDDERKFSLATPLLAARAYKRILCPYPHPRNAGAPSNKEMHQDIDRVFDLAIFDTIKAAGANAGRLQQGKRREGFQVGGNGGARKRRSDEELFAAKGWKHEDYESAAREHREKIKADFAKRQKNSVAGAQISADVED